MSGDFPCSLIWKKQLFLPHIRHIYRTNKINRIKKNQTQKHTYSVANSLPKVCIAKTHIQLTQCAVIRWEIPSGLHFYTSIAFLPVKTHLRTCRILESSDISSKQLWSHSAGFFPTLVLKFETTITVQNNGEVILKIFSLCQEAEQLYSK